MNIQSNMGKRYPLSVVVDTDSGIDDAWAILMVLAAAKQQGHGIHLSAITCVHGNTDVNQSCINVLRTLAASSHLNVPVFKGAPLPIVDVNPDFVRNWKPFFGADGFGCAEYDSTPDLSLIKDENAIVALNRIVSENEGKVSLLCCGPLTNIALAIRTYPKFAEKVREIIIMGGNYKAVGNTTNCAEFNFYMDPEAAHIVLNSAIKDKILVPWETCCQVVFSLEWRDKVLGACDNKAVQLLNQAERPLRAKSSFVDWVCCDQVAAAVFLVPEVATKSEHVYLTVELGGNHTRGQVVIGYKSKEETNATLVKQIDLQLFTQLLLNVHNL